MSRRDNPVSVRQSGRGWRCVTGGARNRLPIRVPRGPSVGLVRPVDHSTYTGAYAITWQAYVTARWLGGHPPMLARLLAGELRQPGTLIADLSPAAARRILLQVHLRPPGLRRLLATLVDAGLLIAARPGDAAHFGTYVLVLPGPLRAEAA
jgi:hypothetical protein